MNVPSSVQAVVKPEPRATGLWTVSIRKPDGSFIRAAGFTDVDSAHAWAMERADVVVKEFNS